jgi:hypothetical protein
VTLFQSSLLTQTYRYLSSICNIPAAPVADEFAGVPNAIVKFAARVDTFTVLSDGAPNGSLRIRILSVAAALAATGNSDAFLLSFAILYPYGTNVYFTLAVIP